MEQEGPTIVVTRICKGCKYFSAEFWKEYHENDDVDMGTTTRCNAIVVSNIGRLIRTYGCQEEVTPMWCPFINKSGLVD